MDFNIISLYIMLLGISLLLYMSLGGYIFLFTPKSKINRLFFLIFISLSLWCLSYIIGQFSVNKETVIIWFKVSTVFRLFYFAILLHFYLALKGSSIRFKKVLYIILYLFCFLIVLETLIKSGTKFNFIQMDEYWFLTNINKSVWFYIHNIFIITSISFSIICLLALWKKTESNKKKKQSFIHIIALCICLFLIIIDNFILPNIISYLAIYFSPLLLIIWAVSVWYSIIEYRFLSITPEIIKSDIIDNSDEYIILLNPQYQIISINNKTESLLHITRDTIKLKSLSAIILAHENIIQEIERMLKHGFEKISCKIQWIKQNKGKNIFNAQISLVKDRFKDIIGFSIVGRDVKETKQLKEIYAITDREMEVVRLMIKGMPNRQIAEILNITERTVKAHLTNIYNKLGVDNKIMLLNAIKDFHF